MVATLMRSSEALEPFVGVQCLLRKSDEKGMTSLIWSVVEQRLALVSLLVNERANVNDSDHKKNTPLIYAVKKKGLTIIELLIKSRAEIYIRNNAGKNAIDYAKKQHNITLENFLRNHAKIQFKGTSEIRFIENRTQITNINEVAGLLSQTLPTPPARI